MKHSPIRKAVAATVLVGSTFALSSTAAWAAADAIEQSNPSCVGLVSSVPTIVGMSRSDLSHGLQAVAADSGSTPGATMHALIGGPGEKC